MEILNTEYPCYMIELRCHRNGCPERPSDVSWVRTASVVSYLEGESPESLVERSVRHSVIAQVTGRSGSSEMMKIRKIMN